MTFSQFTLNNQGVDNLAKVLFTTAFTMNPLFNTCTAKAGVRNGQKLDYVDSMGDVGNTGRKCDPTYTSVTITGFEKTWALGDWSIPKKICYKEIENTIAEYCLRTGTERENIIGTEFWDKILMPLLEKALEDMYWRMAWFSDTAADHITDGGNITNTADLTLLTMCDGLWKRLFAIATANTAQRTTIAANSQSTIALQTSAIKTAGVALGIVDDLVSYADSRIAEASDSRIMLTRSLYQAFRKDYANKYHETIPFMEVADGVKIPTYDGVPILEVKEWDINISKFENSGTALNNPHRGVFVSPKNLFVGTEAKNTLADVTATFDDVTRNNYFYAASNLGTLVGEDALVQVAY